MILDRFWSKVRVMGGNTCWNWREGTSQGYGDFFVGLNDGRQHLGAHVFALAVSTASFPIGAHARARFTPDDIRAMRRLAASGMSTRRLAHLYETNRSHVHRIVTGQTWQLDEGAP